MAGYSKETIGKVRAYWSELRTEFEKSGKKTKEFSAEKGISAVRLRSWIRKFKREEQGGSGFKEIMLSVAEESYRVVLKNGRELIIGGGFREEGLKKLIQVL